MKTYSYWGCGWEDADTIDVSDIDDIADHFVWTSTDTFTFNDGQEDEFITGYDTDPPVVDDITDFDRALALFEEHQYDQAAELFESHIEEDLSAPYVFNSLAKMLTSVKRSNRSLDALKDQYETWATRWEDDFERQSWAARRLGIMCSVYSGDYRTAINEFNQLDDDAPTPSDSLQIEIDKLYVESLIAGNNIDDARQKNLEIERLELLLDEIEGNQEDLTSAVPKTYELFAPYPNPFNSWTTIEYQVPELADIKMSIYNINGRLVSEMINRKAQPGRYKTLWSGRNSPSGMYLCTMTSKSFSKTVKLILVK